jgi:glycosyltransferase involved in cell wall biosynthesis
MRILFIHNKYQQYGGEDGVFQAETELLRSKGNAVDHLVFDNKEIKTTLDKIRSGIGSIYNFKSAKLLEKRIREFQPDIIHVHNFFPLASPSIFYVAKHKQIPIVMTLHNYRLLCPSATLFHNGKIYEKSVNSFFAIDAIVKGVYRNSRIQTASLAAMIALHKVLGTWRTKVDKYIALTHFSKHKFLDSSFGVPENKFTVKPNFVKNEGQGKENREDFFLFVGRLSEEKGIDLLLRANHLRPFPLVIIGDGPLRPNVENFAKGNKSITYLGFQQKPIIIDYMKRAKGLIFSSEYYECFPLTLLEAFSTATPVIAPHLGAPKEIVHDNVNGLLFSPGNEKDLSEKIFQLIEGQELAKKISINARKTYLDLYTPEKNYQQLITIYQDLIDSQRSFSRVAQLTQIVEAAKV